MCLWTLMWFLNEFRNLLQNSLWFCLDLIRTPLIQKAQKSLCFFHPVSIIYLELVCGFVWTGCSPYYTLEKFKVMFIFLQNIIQNSLWFSTVRSGPFRRIQIWSNYPNPGPVNNFITYKTKKKNVFRFASLKPTA